MTPELKKIIAEYVVGHRRELTLIGQPAMLAIVVEATRASRTLYESLASGNIDRVTFALESKRLAVSRYEKVFGVDWGL